MSDDENTVEDEPEAPLVSPGGDVDIADLPDGHNSGEEYRTPSVEDSVQLLEHDAVPEEHVGKVGLVIDAGADQLLSKRNLAKHEILVRIRDETNALLSLPLAAVKVVGRNLAQRG